MLVILEGDSSLVALCWLAELLFLRPNKFKLHRRRLLMRLGGIGGFACTFIFGWLYDGYDSCVNIWEDVDGTGNELEDGEADGDGLGSDMAELDPSPSSQVWLVSGNGYSNRVLSMAKGVPTIWEDGEWRAKSSRFIDFRLVIIGSIEADRLGMWPLLWSPVGSATVVIDVVSESTWESRQGIGVGWTSYTRKATRKTHLFSVRRRDDVRLHRVININFLTIQNVFVWDYIDDICCLRRVHDDNGLNLEGKSLGRGYVARAVLQKLAASRNL